MNFNKELFAYIKNVRFNFILVIASGLLTSIATISQALLLSRIINNVFLQHRQLNDVKFLLLIFLVISVIKSFLIWGGQFFAANITRFLKTNLREKLIAKINNIGPVLIKSERIGELTNTFVKGIDKLEEYFSKFLPQIFLSAFVPIIILIFVFPIDLLTGVIFIFTAPIIPLFMYLIGSIAEKMNKKQWKTLGRMSAYFLDVLLGLTTIKLFNKTKEVLGKVFEVTNSFRIHTMKVLRVAFLSALVLEITATISVAVVAVSIGLRLLNGSFDFYQALFILIIAPEFYLPLRQLGVSYHAGLEGVAAFERINEVLQFKNDYESFSEINFKNFFSAKDSPIIFNNVSFIYKEREQKALNNISLILEPKRITALVGASGSGKTTLMNLLLKFINPTEGKIFIGSTDLRNINDEEWRKNITWIPQNPYIFNSTIFDNIRMAEENATLDEVIEASKKAHIHNYIFSLPDQYQSIIGEDAVKFSGGEIQRLALARAFLRDTPILLIDEPTANLDPVIELEILNDMYKLFDGKTVLIIAHRLNTIRMADKIAVMKSGNIIEYGTHQELIQCEGFYKQLLTLQSETV